MEKVDVVRAVVRYAAVVIVCCVAFWDNPVRLSVVLSVVTAVVFGLVLFEKHALREGWHEAIKKALVTPFPGKGAVKERLCDEKALSVARVVADIDVLRRFVEAGNRGVTSLEVKRMVGCGGKAIRVALVGVVVRLGFSQEEAAGAFVNFSGKDGRMWRLTEAGVVKGEEVIASAQVACLIS